MADLSYLILNITDSSLIEKINNYSIENVSDEDLSDEGRETDYHMTLLANIKTDSELPFKILNDKSVNVELGKVSIFEKDEYDVLKIEVKKSEQLVNLYNKLVNEVDNEVEYDFNPHITIAYIKKGVCKELVNDNEFEGQKIKFDLAKFSPEDENEVIYRKLAKVFHKEIGFPSGMGEKLKWFIAELNGLPTRFTTHYYNNEERTKSVDSFFKYIQLKPSDVFEITTNEQQKIEKIACRIPFGDGRDIVCSINSQKVIITFWFNDFFDTHTTLDTRKYDYAMKKESSVTGYGGWLNPQGEYFPVETPQAHDDLSKQEYEENDFSLMSAINHARDIRGIKKKSSIKKLSYTLYHGTHENFKGFDDNFDYENIPDDIGQIRDYEVPYGVVFLTDSFERANVYGNKVLSYDLLSKKILKIDAGYESPDIFFDNDYNGQNKIWTKFENGGYDAIEISGYTPISGKTKSYITYPNNLVEKNIKQSAKSTSLKLVSYTDLVRVEKLLDSLKYHSFKYRIDGDSLVFDDIDELQDVKTLLDSYGIGNLIKTSKTEDNIEVDHWDFDGRESYSFTLNDDGKELASLQTETYDEGRHGIFDIEVNKNHRRKGLATKLFYYAKEYLNNLGIELVHSNNLSDEGRNWKNSLAGKDYTKVYRGDMNENEGFGNSIWVSEDEEFASEYGKLKTYLMPNNINLLSAGYDEWEELIDEFGEGGDYEEYMFEPSKKFIKFLQSKGYDGFENGDNILICDKSLLKDLNGNSLLTSENDEKIIEDSNDEKIIEDSNDEEDINDPIGWKKWLDTYKPEMSEDEKNNWISNYLKTSKNKFVYLNGKTTGANISELDSIYDYKEIINWVYKNAKKEVGLISKLSKYRWRPSQKQRKEFKEMMQDPEKKYKYDLEKAKRDIKRQETERKRQEQNRNNSKFNYDTAGGSYIPTKTQYDFSINNIDKGTLEQQQAMNEVINGYMDDDKIHHDYIHIVNEMIRNEFSNKQSKKFVYLNKNNYEMKNIKAIKNKLSISEEHLNEDADRFEKIDDEADNIKDEIDELQKDDSVLENKSILKSALNKIAYSRIDGEAWIRGSVDIYDVQSDAQVKAILESDYSREEKERKITSRIEDMLSNIPNEDLEIVNTSNFKTEVDWKEVNAILDDYEEDLKTTEWAKNNSKKSNKDEFKYTHNDVSDDKLQNILNKWKNLYGDVRTDYFDSPNHGKIIYIYYGKTHIGTYVSGEQILYCDTLMDDILRTQKSIKKKSNKRPVYQGIPDNLQDVAWVLGNSSDWMRKFEKEYPMNFGEGKPVSRTMDDTNKDIVKFLNKYYNELNNQLNAKAIKKKSKMEFPNSKNSIIRNVTIWENGSGTEYINNYNYEEDLTDEGIPLQWDYKTLPQEIMDYIYDSGAMDDLGDDYDFGGMDIGFIGNGTTTVNMFRYDSKLKLEHPPRKIKTLGEDYDDMETTNMKKSMKKISQNLNQNEIYILEKLYNMDDKEAIFIPQMNMKKAKENYPMLIKKKYIHIPTLKYTSGFSITREGRDFIESLKNKKSMQKITAIDKYGHEDVYDLEPEMIVSLEDIADDDEMYPENAEHWNMININQSKEVIEAQLMEQINQDFPRDLTYESIFQTAINTGLVDNMDRYNIISVLNNVAINLGLPRTSWDDFFPKDDIVSEIDLRGTDGSITFDEDGEFSPESIINNYDNDADSLFTIDRILDERLKHFINTDELIVESSTVVKSAMTNLKRKQAYVKKYKLGNLHIGDTDRAGRILNGDITYNILLRSVKNRDVEKVIEVTLPIKARRVEMPKTFKFKQDEYPLENYYITDILEQ